MTLTGTALASSPANVDAKRIESIANGGEAGNWLSHGRGYDEKRYSPLTQINDGNVAGLSLAWTHKLDIDMGVEATPIVVDGVMYTTGPFSIVYALDAATGKLLWKHDPGVPKSIAGQGCCGPVNRGVAVWKGKVYVGTFDGRLLALDAATGMEKWSVDTVIDHAKSYTITGAPRIVKGKVLIGNGGAEFGVRGYVTAYDADSGKQAWRFFTVPGDPALPPEDDAMKMALKTWFGNGWVKWGGGGTVWDSMSYDPELNQLYIGVGNGSPFNYQFRSEGKGDNLFLSSIVALDPDTGKYIWHYQTTPADRWDFTAAQQMVLADVAIDGKPRKVLMQAPKTGFFYVLDRTNGKLISAKNIVPINWATHVDLATGRPAMVPEAADYAAGPKLISPAIIGAHNWHPMSYHPKTGLVYIPAQETAAGLEAQDEPLFIPSKSVVNIGLKVPELPEDPSIVEKISQSWRGRLIAWDPIKQEARWSQEYRTIYNGGTLATAGNLVFQGTADGRVLAYAADSGALLWESPANTGVMAGPVSYEAGGEQYITFMAGWGGTFPRLLGPLSLAAKVRPEARILTYKLGGKAQLPAQKYDPVPLPPPPPNTLEADKLPVARMLFNGFCANCHGLNAVSGGVVPDLRYLSTDSHLQFNAIVAGARAAKGMPAFADAMLPEHMELIHQYIIKRAHDLQSELAALKAAK
ncbi:MAG: PQQ-dependent dehydrogenase, methanol/ethanol family [Azoarcus sp.]|nr:PQQ-dependent dehydrogenase, methanol/ethanol family [Azoarcus sp.]